MAKLSLERPWSFTSIRPFWTSKTDKHPAGKTVTIHMFVMTVTTNFEWKDHCHTFLEENMSVGKC